MNECGFPKDEMLCNLERLLIGIGSLEDFNVIYGYNLQSEDDLKCLYFLILGEYRRWQIEQTCKQYSVA